MPSKNRITRRLDLPAPVMHGAVTATTGSAIDNAPPLPPDAPDAPTDVALTTGITYSTASPLAYIAATWKAPSGSAPERYIFQVSESSSFPAASTLSFSTNVPSVRADGLKPATAYYGRVAGVVRDVQGDWANGTPFPITTDSDTSPAAQPTSAAATWIGTGDLLITWTNPTSANFRDVQITIKASSGGATYRTVASAAGRFLYTAAMNLADTSGAGDPSLYVELRSRTFSNVLNNTSVPTLTTTKAAPTAPVTVAHGWAGDPGTAGADLIFAWSAVEDAAYYTINLNSTGPRRVGGTTFTYDYERNVAENGAPGDPSVTYDVRSVDGLGQASSSGNTGTATNAAPVAPTATLEQGVVGGLFATVTSTPPADFWRNEFVFKRDGATVAAVYSAGATYRYEMQGASDGGYHSWTVVVRQEDLFAQFSATHTPAAVAVEALTLGFLRDDIVYSDSLGTAAATLKSALADGETTSGGITYSA